MTDPVPIPSRGAASLPDRAKRIRADYAAIVANGVVLKAIAFGELLTDTQANDGYGLWGSWLKSNCALGDRTAQRYMNLAANKKKLPLEDPTRMSDLTLNEAFRLVADKAAKPATTPDRSCDNAVKALLENLWKLPPSSADYKAKDTIRQLQELVGKMQTEPERKAASRLWLCWRSGGGLRSSAAPSSCQSRRLQPREWIAVVVGRCGRDRYSHSE